MRYYTKEAIATGSMYIIFTPSERQQADILTKPLACAQFTTLRDLILGKPEDQLIFANLGELYKKS